MQASHAALEAGLKDNHTYQQTSSIIIFQIPDELFRKKRQSRTVTEVTGYKD